MGVFCEFKWLSVDGLVQNCSNSIANALELLQSCTKPWIYAFLLQLPCWGNVVLANWGDSTWFSVSWKSNINTYTCIYILKDLFPNVINYRDKIYIYVCICILYHFLTMKRHRFLTMKSLLDATYDGFHDGTYDGTYDGSFFGKLV